MKNVPLTHSLFLSGEKIIRDKSRGKKIVRIKRKQKSERESKESKIARKRERAKEKTYPMVTSKILDPTEEETAMSPSPFLATRTEVIKSGIDVPADSKVNPMISGGMSKFSPTGD